MFCKNPLPLELVDAPEYLPTMYRWFLAITITFSDTATKPIWPEKVPYFPRSSAFTALITPKEIIPPKAAAIKLLNFMSSSLNLLVTSIQPA